MWEGGVAGDREGEAREEKWGDERRRSRGTWG